MQIYKSFIYLSLYIIRIIKFIIMNNYNDIGVYAKFNNCFANINDPRQQAKVKHLLQEILFITVIAVIAGADEITDIEKYANAKANWFKTFLKLPNGIPSHDTFNRVLCIIDPVEFEQCFMSWVSYYKDQLPITEEKDVINIDGKTLCGSADKNTGKKAIHMVSALSTKYGLVLGQKKCAEKSNEITAIPELLNVLDIAGAIITIDAMGCQKKIAKKIINKGADYILALKGNQENLFKEVTDLFEKIQHKEFAHYIYTQDTETGKDHGRIETRHCITINDLSWLFEIHQWPSVKSIAKVTATVFKNGTETVEHRYYISSLPGEAELINRAVRKHWHIENKLHWILDVVFKEDDSRLRSGNGPENLSIIKRIALNATKAEDSMKDSLRGKRIMATYNENYALKIFSKMVN